MPSWVAGFAYAVFGSGTNLSGTDLHLNVTEWDGLGTKSEGYAHKAVLARLQL
jgi:hypothetical protein